MSAIVCMAITLTHAHCIHVSIAVDIADDTDLEDLEDQADPKRGPGRPLGEDSMYFHSILDMASRQSLPTWPLIIPTWQGTKGNLTPGPKRHLKF